MQFHPSPYSPKSPDLGNYGLTAQRTEVTVVGYVSKGSSGADVATLHQALINHPSVQAGYFASSSDVKNKKFGSETESLVRDFQQVSGLSVDGKVGKNTWNALSRPGVHVYEYGSSSSSSSPTKKLTTSGDDATRVGVATTAQKITKKTWFYPVAIGGGVLLLGGIILLTRRKKA